MIVTTNFVPRKFDAITVWPLILIRPENAYDSGLITHEMVHYREQRNSLVLPWLALYALSRRFRIAAEVRGYRAQIHAGAISRLRAAQLLLQYRTGLSMAEALEYFK